MTRRDLALALVALLFIAVSVWRLEDTGTVTIAPISIGTLPARIYRPPAPHHAVVIAHGFAASQQMLRSLALGLAQAGYLVVTFDLPGHGRNAEPLPSQTAPATARLLASVGQAVAYARGLLPGPVAVIGHSMSASVVARYAALSPSVAATVAISPVEPIAAPRDLLLLLGGLEAPLLPVALDGAEPGVTYGTFAAATARRVAVVPWADHIGVLFNAGTLAEVTAWLDQAFAANRPQPVPASGQGGWVLLLLAAILLLGRALARLLPTVAAVPVGAGLGWRGWPAILLPAVMTPAILRALVPGLLPMPYLALHFALFGLICALTMRRAARPVLCGRMLAAGAAAGLYLVAAPGLALDRYFAAWLPVGGRWLETGELFAGALAYFLVAEWLARGAERGMTAALRLALLASLGSAIALQPGLITLAVMLPGILVVFVVCSLAAAWVWRRTGDPLAGAIASAAGFAWAVGVTFPLLAGL